MAQSLYQFGPHSLHVGQLFYESIHSIGFVNIKPIVPGHVLITPKRVCMRYHDLSAEEATDLYMSVHKIAPILEKHYGAEALNIAMQDGPLSGQSVPHVHVHMLPRKPGDFRRNDDVYEELETQELDDAFRRVARTHEEMAAEASTLRMLFPENTLNF